MNIFLQLTCLIFCVLVNCSLSAEGYLRMNPAKKAVGVAVLEEISHARLCQKIRELPADERQKLRDELKRILTDPDELSRTGGNSDFDLYLVALDDKETIVRLAATYERNGRFEHYLKYSGNPKVITALGDDLLKENKDRSIEDIGICGEAGEAWYVIRPIILSAQEFNEKLKTWVRSTDENVLPDSPSGQGQAEIALLREWWKANRAAFQAGEFSRVKPGAEWPVSNPKQRIQDGGNLTPKPDVSIPMKPQEVASSPKIAPLGDEKPSGNAYVWTGIAVILASAAGWLFLRAKGKTK